MTGAHMMNRSFREEHSTSKPSKSESLEQFFWKLFMMLVLVYFIWDDRLVIQLAPVSVESGGGTHLQSANSGFDILHSTEPDRKISTQEIAGSVISGILDPNFNARNHVPDSTISQNLATCKLFVKRFSPVAIAEMRQFNIPASVLLAEAILASNAGTAAHIARTNNYFNLSCNNGPCTGKHYMSAGSAGRSVKLEVFPMIWSSFRARSKELCSNPAFSGLCQGARKTFQHWTEKLGVLQQDIDPNYGAKLSMIIRQLNLEYFDNNF